MKPTFSEKGHRRGFWCLFCLLVFVVLVVPPFQLLEKVPSPEFHGGLYFLLMLAAAVFMWFAGVEIGAPISASKLPLDRALTVLWKGEFKDATGTKWRRALIQEPEGDQRLFEFVGDMFLLWTTFEEGQVIRIEELFVQNDYDCDQDRYDLVIRVL